MLFTNYQFYIDEFDDFARAALADPAAGYDRLRRAGQRRHRPAPGSAGGAARQAAADAGLPPDAHGQPGITMVNIGVGPSNAKTITDHIAVLRPHAWLMLGHCAGLRNTQALGDYVLAHAYVREDHVLDDDLPVWVPIPPLAEVQVALRGARWPR